MPVNRALGEWVRNHRDPLESQTGELIPAYRRAIRDTEEGQAAVVEVIAKPMPIPGLPDG